MSESLLEKIASGDRSAVSDCVNRYGGLVWSLARRFTGSQADAEDAVQEIFISLWKSAERFDSSKSSETTFVAMIARRRLIDLNRKRQTASRAIPGQGTVRSEPVTVSDPTAQVELSDDATEALRVLHELPNDQQEAIKLSVYSGLTHIQIAERMNLPLGTIKTHIRRGLVRVREKLNQSVVVNQGGSS
ncbi:MAG: RNA polymerase sigma factor [Planctomycetaceae bacterium]|nr:RNA polymerase sigma factor [Planctomycetaceae bacterium]